MEYPVSWLSIQLSWVVVGFSVCVPSVRGSHPAGYPVQPWLTYPFPLPTVGQPTSTGTQIIHTTIHITLWYLIRCLYSSHNVGLKAIAVYNTYGRLALYTRCAN